MRLTGFQGIHPRTSPRLIGDAVAQVAENVNLSSGEARPLVQPTLTYVPAKTGTKLSIYLADGSWLTWNEDVDVARSPLPGESRWLYTGEGEPRITNTALATQGAGNNYPAACRALGVPKPITAPTVTPTGGALADVTRFYAYTFYDDWNQESAPSPVSASATGKPDGTWAIAAMNAAPPNSGDITALTYVGNVVVITTTNTALNRAGDKITLAGVTTVTNVNGTWTLTAVDVAAKTMSFTVTSAPAGTYNNTTDSTDTWTRQAPFGTCTKRLYRTTGTTGQFQLVAAGITATTYSDTLSDALILGDELVSTSWEMPPVDLTNLVVLPSGSVCGLSGNEICFSEPFQPHAWPSAYRMKSKYRCVAADLYSSGIVVGTTGDPEVILGHEPGQMTMIPAKGAYPCLSKRSMVSLGDSVGFATAHGFVRIGDNGIDILSKEWYTRDDWDAMDPTTMIAETVRGRLYVMTSGTGDQLLIHDFLDGTGLTTSDVAAAALYADSVTGKLYLSDPVNLDVREFDPVSGLYMTMTWMSKEWVVPEPLNLGAARVNFVSRYTQAQIDQLAVDYAAAVAANGVIVTSGESFGEMNAEDLNVYAVNESSIADVTDPQVEAAGVTFTLFVEGVEIYSKTVTTTRGFTLPDGWKSDTFSVRVSGQALVKSVDLAQSMIGLKNG